MNERWPLRYRLAHQMHCYANRLHRAAGGSNRFTAWLNDKAACLWVGWWIRRVTESTNHRCPMSLRSAFTHILAQHDYCGAEDRDGVTVQTCACDWAGDLHAAHVIDAQIAYLRDNLAQHANELGLKREISHATRQCSYPGSGGPCEGHAHTRFVTEWEPIR